MQHLTSEQTELRRLWLAGAAFALLALTLSSGSASAAAPVVTEDPVARTTPAAAAPVLDGSLTDACWRGRPAIQGLALAAGGRPRKATSVRICHDASALYVGFQCADRRTGDLVTDEKYIWRNDSVEVLIDADRDRRDYLHFFVTASGEKLVWLEGVAGATPDREWSGDWDAKAARTDSGWAAEIRIPFKSLGVSPSKGLAIRANFARNEQELKERQAWMPRVGAVLNAHSMGNVLCADASALRDDGTEALLISGPGRAALTARVRNAGASTLQASARVDVGVPASGRASRFTGGSASLDGWSSARLAARVEIPPAHQSFVDVWAAPREGGSPVLLTSFRVEMPPLAPPACGAVLARTQWGAVWEANATTKVLPQQEPPRARESAVRVSCAGNEYEPFQIVLRPSRALKDLQVSLSDLKGPAVISGDSVSVRLVGTVPVTEPTGPDCLPGEYPDPLMPLEAGSIPADRNTALWFTVYVADGAAPGEYAGSLTIAPSGEKPLQIPLKLRVWGFSLPVIPHLQTAYGCDVDTLCRWQGVTEDEDKKKVADLAWQNFLRHRVSPFSWRRYWDIGEEVKDGVLKLDFTDYDAGHDTWLPLVSAFNVPGCWMRGVARRGFGEEGYPELKKQFLRQVADHLKAKGWFEKGYNYIFDEPDEDKYADVIAESRIWREAAPGLRILLTEQPEPALEGWVDIWTPVLDAYNEFTCKAAQKKGDEVWWYVCMGPKHPFPNNFIDYPAIDHRILHWMNWKYGVTGVLYWQTTYWKGDPWETPMSYADDGKPFGNGDGRLLYPGVRKPAETPVITGPMDSVRWEMIREGIEDYDYLMMLSEKVRAAEKAGEKSERLKQGRAALDSARSLVRTLVDYETDPGRLYEVREAVAGCLERFAE